MNFKYSDLVCPRYTNELQMLKVLPKLKDRAPHYRRSKIYDKCIFRQNFDIFENLIRQKIKFIKFLPSGL